MSWLIDTLLVTGALIALVLVLRRPVGRMFGPGLAYALWALPLLRLALPPLTLPAEPVAAPAAVDVALVDAAAANTSAATSAAATIPWLELGLAIWLAGALAFLVWRVWGYRAMRRSLLAEARPVGEAGAVRLVETPATASPVAFGLTDKVVALPPGFMNHPDRAERDLAIAHELEHHAARDLAVNIAMQPLLALHWFNPVAWLGWRALRRDQEAACDARVLFGADPATRAAYGRLIAGFAQSPRLALAAPMACPISLGAGLGEKSIVHRLRSLTMNEPTTGKRLIGRALIGIGALALPLTASISYATAGPEAPEPPAPPAAPSAPEAPKVVKKVIVIEHQDGEHGDDKKLISRTIERDGKTIVIKSNREIGDAELEARLARIDVRVPDMPDMPDLPDVPTVVVIDKDGKKIERRVIVRHGGEGDGPMAIALGDRHIACADAGGEIAAEADKDGKKQRMRMRFCGAAGAEAHALEAMKRARESIGRNPGMSDEVRTKVLEELDREIERMSKQG
ncbi:MAG: M56 family metallopeptidase [Novosphingobium sp.]